MLCGLHLYSSQISANLGILYQEPQVQSDPQLPPPTPPQIGLQKLAKWILLDPIVQSLLYKVLAWRRFLKAIDYKVPQTAGTWPQFCQNWGQNEKLQWKQYTRGKEKKRKREPKLSPRLLLRGVSPPVLDLPYLLRLELLSQAVTEKDTVNLLNWYPVLWKST
jgi:hypothetical protein